MNQLTLLPMTTGKLLTFGLAVILFVTQQAAAQDIDIRLDPRFNAVAWIQNSAEYQILARQTYRLAQYQMTIAINDACWCADEVQLKEGNFEKKPPAVILDLDETVIDNSPFNARLIVDKPTLTKEQFRDLWDGWCKEEKANLIPGAGDFLKTAEKLGVKVFFISNRVDKVQDATINNLKKLGVSADKNNVLLQNLGDGRGPDKVSRRAMVAKDHRIILLIGDNMGDICSEMNVKDTKQRNETAIRKAEFLGSRWVVFPNPIYGSWEDALPANPTDAMRTDREVKQ